MAQFELGYEALEKQRMFHESEAKYKVLFGGFGSGKTTAGAAEAILLSVLWPNNFGLVGRTSYPELRDSTRKELLDFPVKVNGKDYYFGACPLIRKWNKSENELVLVNGSTIIFRSLEEAFKKIKSLNLGWFWIDELTETSEDVWLGLVGRLRRKMVRREGFGTTNPEGRDWAWKMFVQNPQRDTFYVTVDSRENHFLPDGYVDDLEKKYPQEWIDRYVHCSFDTFSGLIYREFQDREPYVIKRFEIPDHWYRFVAIDHGYRNPTAVLWGAVDPKGNVVIYDEFYQSGRVVDEIAEVIKTKSKRQAIRQYIIDPATRQNKGLNAGKSIFTEFEESGIFPLPAFNTVGAGINRVQEYLKLQRGQPRLRIFSDCQNLRTEMLTYRWKDLRPGAKQDEPEKPLKKQDHAVDALRYLICYLYDTPETKPKGNDYDYKLMLRKRQEDNSGWMAA